MVLTPGNVVRVTAGAEVIQHFLTTQRGETEAGPVLFDDRGNPGRNDPFTSVGGYAIGDFAFSKRFKVSAGARLDYFSNVDKYDPLRAFSPRVAVIAKPYAAGNLKVMLGKAFRTPSVYELYYQSSQQVRAQGLQPEQVFSGEVELTHHFTPSVSGIVAGFTNYVADLIELTDVGQVVPAGEPLAHDQPPLDAPALKVVLAGTVSVRVTPVALPGPALP